MQAEIELHIEIPYVYVITLNIFIPLDLIPTVQRKYSDNPTDDLKNPIT